MAVAVAAARAAGVRRGVADGDGAAALGVAPEHCAAFVDEHWPHAPEGSQVGVAPPQSPSPPQARQAWVPASQMGLVPPHWALVTHDTQVPLPVLQ